MLYIRHYSERIITHIISTGQDKMRSEVKVKVMGGGGLKSYLGHLKIIRIHQGLSLTNGFKDKPVQTKDLQTTPSSLEK